MLLPTPRSRRRWLVAAGVVAAAAVALLVLRGALTRQQVRRDADADAAMHHHDPGDAGKATLPRAVAPPAERAPATSEPTPTPPRTTRPRAVPVTPPEPSLADEMQRMRAAQVELTAGDPRAALARLDAYIEAFPAGRLHEEYLALRAIALCGVGPPPAGRAEAEAFVAAHPRSMFAERVRGACGP